MERWIRRELSNLTSFQQVTCIVQLQLIRILFSCFEIVVGEICHFLMGTLNSWIGLNSCRFIMLCSGAEQVTLTIPLSAQRCNIYELQQTATVSNCLVNSSIPHCALVNYYKIEIFFLHSSLYRSGKSRRFNHNKFQRSQILSNGSFPCPLKGEILLQTINSHKKLKCYLTWLLIFFLFFFFFGTTYLHNYPIPSPLLYICLFYNNCFCFLPPYFHFFNPQIPYFLFVHFLPSSSSMICILWFTQHFFFLPSNLAFFLPLSYNIFLIFT